jgi:Ribosomal RNA adenine dimethylase
MPLQSSARALKKPLRLDDEVRFLRSWIEKPLHVGAVMPSGRLLARTMAQYVDASSQAPVVELGPGTGAITSALIERGIDQKRLVLVEYNPGFCALLRDRYPHATVVQGDAYTLRDSLRNVLGAPASAVVFPCARPWGAVRAVHLFGRAANPEIAARSLHGSFRAHLDEYSAGPGLGVPETLKHDPEKCVAAFPARQMRMRLRGDHAKQEPEARW